MINGNRIKRETRNAYSVCIVGVQQPYKNRDDLKAIVKVPETVRMQKLKAGTRRKIPTRVSGSSASAFP